jgi:hypothetical protein
MQVLESFRFCTDSIFVQVRDGRDEKCIYILKITIFQDVMQYSLVERYQHFMEPTVVFSR